jgi:hypothetical protein
VAGNEAEVTELPVKCLLKFEPSKMQLMHKEENNDQDSFHVSTHRHEVPVQLKCSLNVIHHHHHKHPGLGQLVCSFSRVKVVLSIVSLVSQLFAFLVGCISMILKGFGFVAFFAGVKASSFCIHLSCLVCSLSVVRGELSRLFCSHKGRNLSEVSIASFLRM